MFAVVDRRGFFKDGFKELARGVWKTPIGRAVDRRLDHISNLLAPQTYQPTSYEGDEDAGRLNRGYPRPPGAVRNFESKCTRCGDCIIACPYGVLFTLNDRSGPMLDPNYTACRLCETWPCVTACEEEALMPLAPDELPRFGQARLVPNSCLNAPDIREREKKETGKSRLPYCRACADACPVEDVIHIAKNRMPTFSDGCTGCGQCVDVCPTFPRAIEIVDPSDGRTRDS